MAANLQAVMFTPDFRKGNRAVQVRQYFSNLFFACDLIWRYTVIRLIKAYTDIIGPKVPEILHSAFCTLHLKERRWMNDSLTVHQGCR